MDELARVYARALFEVAAGQGKLDLIREQLGQFVAALNDSRELSAFFFSPYFSTQEKDEAIGRVLDGADPIFENFLHVLIENHRMPVIHRAQREYESLWEEEHKLLPVEITSAIDLDEKITRAVADKIGERTGRTIELTTRVEPDILGGIVVRVGNSILDASIRSRLEQLRRQVASAAA